MWQNSAPVQGGGYVKIPTGDYVADLKEMKLAQSKKGKWQVISTYEIIVDQQGGGNEGQTVKRFDGLEDETNIGYFKGYCEIIGFDVPQDLNTLQAEMDAFIEKSAQSGEYFDIHVDTSPGEGGREYTNVYVNGVNGEFVAGEGTVEEGAAEVVEEQVADEVQQQAEQVQPMRRFAPKAAPVMSNGGSVRQVAKPAPVAAAQPLVRKPAAQLVRKTAAVRR
jgi:hypothetical protein